METVTTKAADAGDEDDDKTMSDEIDAQEATNDNEDNQPGTSQSECIGFVPWNVDVGLLSRIPSWRLKCISYQYSCHS